MTDIVERLRDRHICPCEFADHDNAILEAADEITRLRAEVERLRAALKSCIAMLEQLGYTPISKVARAALEGQ